MNPATVCTAITTALGVIPDVHLYDYADDAPNSPSFMVVPRLVTSEAFDFSTATFTILGLAASTATKAGHNLLCSWLADDGDQSVRAAIEAENTLGGTVNSARILESSYEPAVVLPDGRRYFGARWTVEIYE
jgi:hypothetical protein